MLLHLELLPKKHKTKKKNIHGALHRRVLFDLVPGLLHFFTPVDIIKHKDGIVMQRRKQLVKICKSWFVPVVAIDVRKVDG